MTSLRTEKAAANKSPQADSDVINVDSSDEDDDAAQDRRGKTGPRRGRLQPRPKLSTPRKEKGLDWLQAGARMVTDFFNGEQCEQLASRATRND